MSAAQACWKQMELHNALNKSGSSATVACSVSRQALKDALSKASRDEALAAQPSDAVFLFLILPSLFLGVI